LKLLQNFTTFIQQFAYIQFNSIITSDDPKYVNSSYWFNNTPDGEAVKLSSVTKFFVEILREQQRIKLTVCKDEADTDYSLHVLSTPVDSCKISKGVKTNILTKVLHENFKLSFDDSLTCPFKKNSVLRLDDCLITDTFLPPMLVEKRFRYEGKFFGIIKGKKGWTYLYTIVLHGRYKK
jgi:hypothetical protein